MRYCESFKRRTVLRGVTGTLLSVLAGINVEAGNQHPSRLPVLGLEDLNGKRFQLDGYRDTVVMVNLWATWCPPCRAEMPSIERLYQSFKGRPFEVLGINQGESGETVKARLGLFNPAPSFPLLLDSRSQVGHFFGVTDLPFSLIFNRQGLLVGKADGARDYSNATVRQRIEKLVA